MHQEGAQAGQANHCHDEIEQNNGAEKTKIVQSGVDDYRLAELAVEIVFPVHSFARLHQNHRRN